MNSVWRISDCYNKLMFRRNSIKYGSGLETYGIIRLKKESSAGAHIGNNVIIRSHWRSNPAGGGQSRCLIAVVEKGELNIGNNVGISNSTIFCSKYIRIEDHVNIGVNCVIYDTDFHSVLLEKRIYGNTEIKEGPVIIREGAWICGHCIVLKGVEIGKGSVVAAGSVVTKSIPELELWGGSPAKRITSIAK